MQGVVKVKPEQHPQNGDPLDCERNRTACTVYLYDSPCAVAPVSPVVVRTCKLQVVRCWAEEGCAVQ